MKKESVISSFIWKFLERISSYFIQFVIQIILARILLPNDYGIVAIVSIFIGIANVFIQTGFNTALIQKKEVDDLDYSSVFYLTLFVSFILYIILFLCSPFIADFYNNEILSPVLRVLSLSLFIGSINSIQNAVVAKNMQFKKNFYSNFIAALISGIVGVVMAHYGCGVWSLVVQQLLNLLIVTVVLFFIINWRPKFLFSFARLKNLFSFGWKLLCSSLIDNIYTNIYDLIIGKKYTATDLAYYNRGKQFPNIVIVNINGAISSVLLPAMSNEQDKKEKVKELTRRAIKLSCFIIFPMMFGLAIVAEPMVKVLLTDKWLECIPFLQILCFSYILWPIHTANLQAINAIGRSDVYLRLEIIKKIIGIIMIIITIPLGIKIMAYGQILTGIISSFINASPNKKLLNYSYWEQIKDILPTLIISIIMSIVIYPLKLLKMGNLLLLLLQCIIGLVVYILINLFIKNDSLMYIVNLLKRKKAKK